jgi:predicted acylesterase/phospholipase RssA
MLASRLGRMIWANGIKASKASRLLSGLYYSILNAKRKVLFIAAPSAASMKKLNAYRSSFLHKPGCSFLLLLTALSACFAAAQSDASRTALVLSGGGSRGLAQIGVLKALEENDIRPDIIVATSMGAIIGALYAAGYSADSIVAMARNFEWDRIFGNNADRKSLLVSQKAEPINYLLELRFADDLSIILPKSLTYGQYIYTALSPLLAGPLYKAGMDFDSLPIALRVVATDLVKGQSVVFSKGNLAQAVRASCGIPLAFAPLAKDSMLLLDGGLTANIPVEAALESGANFIIAVDVTSPMYSRDMLDHPVHFVNQIVAIGIEKKKMTERQLADILIEPPLDSIIYTDFDKIESIVQKGYEAALDKMDVIKAAQRSAHGSPSPPNTHLAVPITWRIDNAAWLESELDSLCDAVPVNGKGIEQTQLIQSIETMFQKKGLLSAKARVASADSNGTVVEVSPGYIKNVVVEGNERTSARIILSAIELKPGKIINRESVQRAIEYLYATGLFDYVNIQIDPDNALRILLSEKNYWRARLGLRFDQFHLGEGYIQPAYENLFGLGMCALLHIQYGLRREKYAFELHANSLLSPKFAHDLRLQTYIARERVTEDSIFYSYPDPEDSAKVEKITHFSEMTLRKAGALIMAGAQVGRIALLTGGFRIERFAIDRSNVGQFEELFGPEAILLRNYRNGIRHLIIRLIIDDLDRYPFPRRGQKHYFTFGGATDVIGGTENYIRFQGDARYYFTFFERHTFSPQLQFAWSDGPLPSVERVYLGGIMPEEKFRDLGVFNYVPFVGLRPRSLPGDMMLVANIGYRCNLQKKFYLNALLNWGYSWNHAKIDKSAVEMFLNESPLGLGLGISYESIIGPINLSWGRLLLAPEAFKLKTGKTRIAERNMIYFSAGYDF